jgi:hypothetical protein
MIEELHRARKPRLRATIIAALVLFAPRARLPVLGALTQVLKDETDPDVRAMAERALLVAAGQSPPGAGRPPDEAGPVPGDPAGPGAIAPGPGRASPAGPCEAKAGAGRNAQVVRKVD